MSQPLVESFSLSRSSSLGEPIEVFIKAPEKKLLSEQDEKCLKTFHKAIREHDCSIVPPGIEKQESPLYLDCLSHSAKGKRTVMEDAHLDHELDDGRLIGIFDGHGEKGRIARQVRQIFKEEFQNELDKTPNDLKGVFQRLCELAQSKITDRSGGTTALVTYYEDETNRAYTATLGDSEMKIYRKVEDGIVSIPVSCVRDWKSPKDEKRAVELLTDEKTRKEWLAIDEAKRRYFPPLGTGAVRINLARSLGDLQVLYEGKTAVSRKPKVSLCQLKSDDRVIFACDGLWDFIDEEKFIKDVIEPCWDSDDLAERAVTYAIKTCNGTDNVTVIAGRLLKEPPVLESTQSLEDLVAE